MGAKYTQAQNKATQKYVSKHYDRISITVKKGERDEIKKAAGERSLNDYVVSAIHEKMDREK